MVNSEVDASVVLKKMQDRVGELVTTIAILEARLEAAEASAQVQTETPVVTGNVVNNATPQVVTPEVVTAEAVNPQPAQDNSPQLPDMPSDVYVPPSA